MVMMFVKGVDTDLDPLKSLQVRWCRLTLSNSR